MGIKYLSEFLDLYNRTEERLTNIVHEYINKEINWITENIKESFKNCAFTYANNWDSDVNEIIINNIGIDEINTIKVEDNRAIIRSLAKVRFIFILST